MPDYPLSIAAAPQTTNCSHNDLATSDMTPALILPLTAIGLLVGILIGCIGIGGVLLVPSLTYIGQIDIHIAIASCMLSYLFSGLIGAIMYANRGSIRWSMTGWLCAGAMPGAYVGAASVHLVPGKALELIIAVLIVAAGANALREQTESAPRDSLAAKKLAAIGAVTGFGSAMTGTGGPLILVPVLVWLKVPVLTAVGLSQIIQLPVATLATIGNFIHGRLDVILGIAIAAVLMVGVALGARLAHAVSSRSLKRVVAAVMITIGVMIATRIVYAYVSR
ncbi:MAG: sulfite exporter TauE/SafE family protein [Gammaproteobacteria bacterium]